VCKETALRECPRYSVRFRRASMGATGEVMNGLLREDAKDEAAKILVNSPESTDCMASKLAD
jgi:hypothetical protein